MKKRYTDEQMACTVKQIEEGRATVPEVSRKMDLLNNDVQNHKEKIR